MLSQFGYIWNEFPRIPQTKINSGEQKKEKRKNGLLLWMEQK